MKLKILQAIEFTFQSKLLSCIYETKSHYLGIVVVVKELIKENGFMFRGHIHNINLYTRPSDIILVFSHILFLKYYMSFSKSHTEKNSSAWR